MSTERLFDIDSGASEFDAEVLEVIGKDGKFTVVLDKTLFFPEAGGQSCDTGTINGVSVSYVYEKDRIIYHECDGELHVGEKVHGEISYAARLRKMQNHTGEHIISGIVHTLYGYDNVGFHLSDSGMTIDYNGELTREQLEEIELLANGIVIRCLPVKAYYPSESELASMDFRSKLDLKENVRIVDIQGVDKCACCAPHLTNTGKVGIIKILDFMRYKGGVRLQALCGLDALEDYGRRCSQIYAISTKISAKQSDIELGVDRLLLEIESLKGKIAGLKKENREYKLQTVTNTEGNICFFDDVGDITDMRYFANEAVKKCSGICGVFGGNDTSGYRYVIMSKSVDLKEKIYEINTALSARGGGSSEMITGTCNATREEIEKYFG